MSQALYPFAGDHAVQSAAFALEWQQELSPADSANLSHVQKELAHELPDFRPSQTVVFQMGVGAPQVHQGAVAGFMLLRPSLNGGVARSLEVDRNRCVAQINDYSRWKTVWPQVSGWLNSVGSKLERRNYTAIGMQYNDVFHWRDNLDNFTADKVFQENSPFIPTNAMHSKDAWHSHHGYFEEISNPLSCKINHNVNINILDNSGQRSIAITTVHRALVSFWEWNEVSSVMDNLMEVMHSSNKKILGSILSAEAAKLIKLNEGGEK